MRKKVGNAVKRNRIKRKLKSIVQKLLKINSAINSNYTYIIFGKTKVYEKHNEELFEKMKKSVGRNGPNIFRKLSETIRNHGTDPGPVMAMSRVKPDGEEISWRLTLSSNQRMVPLVIDWGDTPNPATITPKGCLLTEVRVRDPHPDRIVALYQQLGLDIKVSEGPSALEIILQRPNGGTSTLSQFSA